MNAEADAIRDAIVREEYHDALVQWNAYVRHLRQALETGVVTTEQMTDARMLLEWSRPILVGARAQLRARYHDLDIATAYTGRPGSGGKLVETRL